VKRILFGIVMVALVWSVAASAQSGYQLFQQALSKEQAEGKLADAIVIYQRIVKEFAGDHALAAKALLRLGEAYHKLGDRQAQAAFERIVRDYADQTEAVAIARTRLARNELGARTTATTLRKIWADPKVDTEGTVSPDGRYLSYVDWFTGELALHDFTTGTDRRITNKGTWLDSNDFAEESAISKDGKQVAYAWFNAVIRTHGACSTTKTLTGLHRLIGHPTANGLPSSCSERIGPPRWAWLRSATARCASSSRWTGAAPPKYSSRPMASTSPSTFRSAKPPSSAMCSFWQLMARSKFPLSCNRVRTW
jgi:hypothetical protein